MTSALAASPGRIALAAADKVARPARQIGVTIAAAAILPPQLAILQISYGDFVSPRNFAWSPPSRRSAADAPAWPTGSCITTDAPGQIVAGWRASFSVAAWRSRA